MKEKLEAKIEEIIEYILEKNVTEIDYNDYFILDSTLKNIRAKEQEAESKRQLAKTMAQLAYTPFGSFGA